MFMMTMMINITTRIAMIMTDIIAEVEMIIMINITAGTDLTTRVVKDTRILVMIRFLKTGEMKLW
jgi:hypothetical protein